MADIYFRCPACDGHLVVDDRGAGMELPCPFCQRPVSVPRQAQSAGATKQLSQSGRGSERANPWPEDEAVKSEEIRRLSAMMKTEENFLAPTSGGGKRSMSFRCPSCGLVIAGKQSDIGNECECGACGATFRVPDVSKGLTGDAARAKVHRAVLPEAKSASLRTIDDMRKARPVEGESDVPVGDLEQLDSQFQELVRRELAKLQGQTPVVAQDPVPIVRRRPPPPLGDHGEVVSSLPAKGNGTTLPKPNHPAQDPNANRRQRIGPQARENAPLPPLVTIDTMDLDSEVARQWGEGAVVHTGRLNGISIVLLLILLGVGGWAGYHYLYKGVAELKENQVSKELPGDSPAGEVPAVAAEPVVDLAKIKATLKAFHEAISPDDKALYVRHKEAVLPAMRDYYRLHEAEPRSFNEDSLQVVPFTEGDVRCYGITGEYRDFKPFQADLEEMPTGEFLLDWKSWVGSGEMNLDEFISTGREEPTLFRLYVENNSGFYLYDYSAKEYEGYTLKDGENLQLLYGYAPRGSEVARQLDEAFRAVKKDNQKSRVRLTLKLRFHPEKDKSRAQVLIDEVVRLSWVDVGP